MRLTKNKKALLKLSGKLFSGSEAGYNFDLAGELAAEIKYLKKEHVDLAVVIGGGNIIRGRSIDPTKMVKEQADYMGMLATIINCLALSAVWQKNNIDCVVLSPWQIKPVVQLATPAAIKKAWQQKKIIIFAGGTGKPGVSTDTAAVWRASQIKADIILKATDVVCVYDSDPRINKQAKKISSLTWRMAYQQKLKIMDEQAFRLAEKKKIPILIFELTAKNVRLSALGGKIGTLVSASK